MVCLSFCHFQQIVQVISHRVIGGMKCILVGQNNEINQLGAGKKLPTFPLQAGARIETLDLRGRRKVCYPL